VGAGGNKSAFPLASERAKGRDTKKIATINEMNEAAASGWAGEIQMDKLPNSDADEEGA